MLTYRTGAAGAPSAARFMSEHLLQQTLTPEMVAMAEYYEQGVTPPTQADAAASRYGHLAVAGKFPEEDELDELVRIEAARLRESVLGPDGGPLESDTIILRSLAAFTAAGLIDREAARGSLERLAGVSDEARLEYAITDATNGRDHSSATATPRRDMNPALASRLGIDPHHGLRPGEVAFLLNGQRADGKNIEGQAKLAPSPPIAQVFGLDPRQRPTREQLEQILAGRRADGEALLPQEAARAVRRFNAALGVDLRVISAEQRENILSGLTADGRHLTNRQYQALLEAAKARIGYIDLTFSAPKSVSIGWAFAPTKAERAIIHQAHRDAIDSVMVAIEKEIGRAAIGRSARNGYEPGSIGWVSFDHYAARPTVEVIRTDELGQSMTELHTLTGTKGRVPGDMQVHTHVAVFNAVETPTGRLGSLDLAQTEGRIHEWGALYQAYLASNLRTHGVEVELDRRTDMARISTVPDSVVAQFSKRTVNGTDAARAYARSQGLDWDSMNADRKVVLLKSGVQNPREAKTDDISDVAAWRQTAAVIGYDHRSVLRPDGVMPPLAREQRLEAAFQAALPLLGKQFDRRAVIDGSDARIAAAKGLIAAGIEVPEDVSAITRAFRERGVRRRGEDAALIWGIVQGTQGRDRVALTTTLDAEEESNLIATARTGSRDRSAALSGKQIDAAVAAFPDIDFANLHGRAQRKIVDRLATGGRVGLAIGVAGSGKSTLLRPLVRAWQDDGRTVYGIALAWRQSDDLVEAGIPARNTRAVASLLRAMQSSTVKLDRNSVVVVDEVGLLGTRQLNEILAAQKKSGFQLVMIGDPKQMQSVEAGAVIDLLRRAFGDDQVPELGSSVRQRDAEERETVLMFRNGQTAEAIRTKDENGTLRIAPGGYREAIVHVAELWQQRRDANQRRPDFKISVSAPTNAEAHDVSLAIRVRRQNLGEIGPDKIKVDATDAEGQRSYELALTPGDRVRLFKRTNAKFVEAGTVGNIGRNGTVLEITAVRDDGLMMRNPAGKEGLVAWSTLKDGRTGRILLAYGDALTTNTAQGTTVTEHIHAIPSGSRLVSAFGAYTSGSRHREQSFVVTSEGAERAEILERRPLGDQREIMPSDILANITRNFADQPVRESALDMIDRAATVRRGSIQMVQRSLQSMESRVEEEYRASALRERFENRRISRLLEDRLPGVAEYLRRHATTFTRLARAMTTLTERIAETARRRIVKRPIENEYWRTAQTAEDVIFPGQKKVETKERSKGSGLRRNRGSVG